MDIFKIGKTNFGIGEVTLNINEERGIITDLAITANQQMFDAISEDEDGDWNWALYPPKIYFRGLHYKKSAEKIKIDITDVLLDECDIALYFMEHFDVYGKLVITKNLVEINGEVEISGENYPLEIVAKAK